MNDNKKLDTGKAPGQTEPALKSALKSESVGKPLEVDRAGFTNTDNGADLVDLSAAIVPINMAFMESRGITIIEAALVGIVRSQEGVFSLPGLIELTQLPKNAVQKSLLVLASTIDNRPGSYVSPFEICAETTKHENGTDDRGKKVKLPLPSFYIELDPNLVQRYCHNY